MKLILFLCLAASVLATEPGKTIRGKLVEGPALLTADHGKVLVAGDEDTTKTLHDQRLAGMELEVTGHFTAPGRFAIDPSYTRSLVVLKDGKRLYVTYWCPVCSIRTHVPGKCWCCQKETELDLQELYDP